MMSEWISVKDKLPAKDDYNDYLITDGEHCYVGHYRHDIDTMLMRGIIQSWIGFNVRSLLQMKRMKST